jgi:molecular chaperone GrpE (heat shock protein)
MKWLKRVFGGSEPGAAGAAERILALEREVQALRLELAEREKTVANLKRDLESQRSGEAVRLDAAVHATVEQLLSSAGPPATQLAKQAHLLEAEGRAVPARDVLAVARRLVSALEEAGLRLEGSIGERVPYNPNRHEPLNAAANLTPGQAVVIRFAGVSYRGKMLRRAGVELAE